MYNICILACTSLRYENKLKLKLKLKIFKVIATIIWIRADVDNHATL